MMEIGQKTTSGLSFDFSGVPLDLMKSSRSGAFLFALSLFFSDYVILKVLVFTEIGSWGFMDVVIYYVALFEL